MKQRIEWVDNLKAMAIFLVVFGHVEGFSIDHLGGFFHRLQGVFCMPLFFFLSGLFAKPQYNYSDSIICIKNKFLQLMVPFIICCSFFVLIMSSKPWWSLFYFPNGGAHMGYWFILVLFEFYLLFTLCQILTRRFTKNLYGKTFLMVALVIECVFVIILVLSHFGILSKEPWSTIISFDRIYYNGILSDEKSRFDVNNV